MEIKLVYTTSAQLNNLPVIDGQVTVLTDKTAFYYDMNGSRHSFIDKVPADLGFGYGTCSTATSTAAKTSSVTGYSLATGGLVAIKFDNAVDANATLNISSKGAKPIYYRGQAVTAGIISANSTALIMYDGTNYNIVSVDDDIIDDSQLSTSSTYSSQKIEDTYINQDVNKEHTASTSFESYNGGLLSSLKVALTPNQDLHGYSEPWVGGSRKNKFEVTATTTTEQGVLFNVNSDGTITTTRQSASSNNASIILGDFTLPVGSYKINGANNAGTGGYFTLRKASDNTFIANIESSGYDLNVTDATFEYRLTCVVQSAVSPTGNYETVKPMIRLATESDPTFAPYSNICPISGHTQVKVGDDGKNLLPNNITTVTAYGVTYETQEDGSIEGNGTSTGWANANLVNDLLLKAGTYILSGTTVAGAYITVVPLPDTGANYSAIGPNGTIQITFDNDTHVLVRVSARAGTVLSNAKYYPMLRLASDTDPTFVPYNGYQITVNLGGTYYGGTIDIVSGVLTVTNAILDLGSKTWTKSSVRHYTNFGVSNPIRPYAPSGDDTYIPTLNDGMCTDYVATSRANIENVQYGFSIHSSGGTYITIRDKRYDELSGADFKTVISGVYLCYKLATPQTIQLSPTMVKALVGENHLSAPLDGQEITESVYSPLAKWNAVIQDSTTSADTTWSSNKLSTELNNKVDKVTGKGLSANDYTNADKTKLAGIATGAEVNVQSDWNQTDSTQDDYIKNKPTSDEQTATDTFETINGGLLSSLKVALTPNQDLHGYTEPWVGGSRKNKLPNTATSITRYGITLTVYSDGTVIGNGTATNIVAVTYENVALNGEYILNGCPSGGGSGTYELQVVTATATYRDYGDGVTFTVNGNCTVQILIRQGATLNNAVFKPMIRLATESDPTFEPYSNICPITGHTQSKVGVDGKNLCPLPSIQGLWLLENGEYSNRITWCCTEKFSIKPNTAYVVSATRETRNVGCVFWDANGGYIGFVNNTVYGEVSLTFTTPTNCRTIAICIADKVNGQGITPSDVTDLQLELGSTATAYVPYNGYQITVKLGGTYYSGTLDVVSGKLTVDKAFVKGNGLTWLKHNTSANNVYYSGELQSIIKRPSDNYTIGDIVCSDYVAKAWENVFDANQVGVVISTSGLLGVANPNITTLEDFQTAIADTDICYGLSTPTTIQLSPTMVKALVGKNNLSAPLDGQEITESKYRELFTWDEVESLAESKVQDIKCHETGMGTYDVKAHVGFDGTISYTWNRSSFKTILLNDTVVMPPINQIRFSDSSIRSSSICELLFLGDSDVPTITHVAVSTGQVTFTLSQALESTVSCTCRVTNRIL